MHPDLDSLKNELPADLERRGIVIFHGESRLEEGTTAILWDVERRPDYREFLDCAQRLGAKLVVVHAREFEQRNIDDVLEELADTEIPSTDRRELERRLKKLQPYTGFTSQIELSFDFEQRVYMYESRSEFMDELLAVMAEIDAWYPETEDGDEEEPLGGGGFFSRN